LLVLSLPWFTLPQPLHVLLAYSFSILQSTESADFFKLRSAIDKSCSSYLICVWLGKDLLQPCLLCSVHFMVVEVLCSHTWPSMQPLVLSSSTTALVIALWFSLQSLLLSLFSTTDYCASYVLCYLLQVLSCGYLLLYAVGLWVCRLSLLVLLLAGMQPNVEYYYRCCWCSILLEDCCTLATLYCCFVLLY